MFCFLSYTHSFLSYWGAEQDPAVSSPFTATYTYKISDIFVESVLHLLFAVLDLKENCQVTYFKLFISSGLRINMMVTGQLCALVVYFVDEKTSYCIDHH